MELQPSISISLSLIVFLPENFNYSGFWNACDDATATEINKAAARG